MAGDKPSTDKAEHAAKDKSNEAVESQSSESSSRRLLDESRSQPGTELGRQRADQSARASSTLESDNRLGKLTIEDKSAQGARQDSRPDLLATIRGADYAKPHCDAKKDSGYVFGKNIPSLFGESTITQERIEKLINWANNQADRPANRKLPQSMAKDFMDAAKETGVNAAYAVAHFYEESSLGKAGHGPANHSIGNMRDHDAQAKTPYRKFDNWKDGILAWSYHMRDVYGKDKEQGGLGVKSLNQEICYYAPNGDGANKESRYVKNVADRVRQWDDETKNDRTKVEPKPHDQDPKVEPKPQDQAPKVEPKPLDQAPKVEPKPLDQTPKVEPKPQDQAPKVEPKPQDQAPKVEPTDKPGQYKMSKEMMEMARPEKGDGYYQTLSNLSSEVLGRDLNHNEIRGLVAGARALRKEQGHSLNTLSKDDVIIPKNDHELKTFVDNIGNRRFGSHLSKAQAEKLKEEFSTKYKSAMEADSKPKADKPPEVGPGKDKLPETKEKPKTPEGGFKTGDDPFTFTGEKKEPAPEQKKEPEPEQKKEPAPEQKKEPVPEQKKEPVPEQKKEPAPEQKKEPAPEQKKEPAPEQKKEPAPEQKKEPAPEQKKEPAPEQKKEPAPEQKKEPGPEQKKEPAPEQKKEPAPEQKKEPAPEQKKEPAPDQDPKQTDVPQEDDHDGDDLPKLQPGTLNQNVNIIRLAEGAPKQGAQYITAAKVLNSTNLREPAGLAKDTPVAVVPGMKPGTMGLLVRRDSEGNERNIPFIAGQLHNGKGTREDIALNPAAAAALGIQPGKGNYRLDAVGLSEKSQAKDLPGLQQEVADKIKTIASQKEVLDKANEVHEGRELKDKAYIPKPDDNMGYRRTDRSEAELGKIKQNMERDAEKYHDLAQRLQPSGDGTRTKDAQSIIDKTLKDASSEKKNIEQEKLQMQRIESLLRKGTPATDIPERLLKDLPADIARDLNLARYNRNAYKQNSDAINDFSYNPFGTQTDKLTENVKTAERYYKMQESRALERAHNYARVADDKAVLQQRIIDDASNPKAQELLRHRFETKAAAAAVMAANPDLVSGATGRGALEGKRIAINGGHDPFHGSPTPGFGPQEWTKTEQNKKGMGEYDFNKQSSAILASMVEYAGGVPIHVNQDELYKTNPSAQKMAGLANAMKDTKADVIISNHMDDFPGMAPGTLTLVSSKSHNLGALINSGKSEVAGVNAKPLREQGRGVQAAVHQSNMILNELLTTSPGDRQKALNPYEVGKIQLGLLIGMERFLHPRSNSQIAREKQRDSKGSSSWQELWNKNAPKQQFYSLPYPSRF